MPVQEKKRDTAYQRSTLVGWVELSQADLLAHLMRTNLHLVLSRAYKFCIRTAFSLLLPCR